MVSGLFTCVRVPCEAEVACSEGTTLERGSFARKLNRQVQSVLPKIAGITVFTACICSRGFK